jgi:hypothetical protein
LLPKYLVLTSDKTKSIIFIEINWLMLFKGIIAVYPEKSYKPDKYALQTKAGCTMLPIAFRVTKIKTGNDAEEKVAVCSLFNDAFPANQSGRQRRWNNLRTYPGIFLEGMRKN